MTKKLNNTQILLIISTLILGLAYFMFGDQSKIGISDQSDTDNLNNINKINNTEMNQKNQANLLINHWQTDPSLSKNNHGIDVFFVRAPELPMVDVQITFNAGAAHSQIPGLASITSAMLTEGTNKYPTEELFNTLESVGANISSSVNKDSASISMRSLTDPEKLTVATDVLTSILNDSNFPNKSFKRIINQSIEGLKLSEQYPDEISSKLFYKQIYGSHPYAVPTTGSIESLNTITREQIISFYKNYYTNKNSQIAIVGALTEDQARKLANTISQNIFTGNMANPIPEPEKLNKPTVTHKDFPSTQTHIFIGALGIKRTDPDYFALTVGNHILGTMPLTSLLFKDVRIKNGLAYSVYSNFITMKDAGPFLINMQTRNDKANDALDISKNVLKSFMQNGPSQADLDLAKQNLIGQFPLGIASNSKKLGVISSIGFYNLPLDYLDTYINNINKITVEDIKTAFNKHIDLNKLAIVTVGNQNTTDTNEKINATHSNINQNQG